MSRNRTIYQSESLFVGNSVDATTINDNQELIRVQGASYGFNINRTDINQYGRQLRIDTVQLESPTVTFDFSYYLGDGSNEKNIGFNTSANYQFAGAFMDSFSGNNFYILTSEEGQDSVDFKSGDYYNMIGIGNAFLTNYNVNLSVGSAPIAELSYEAVNISSQNGLISGNLITGDLPSIEPELGNPIEGIAKMKAPVDRGFTGPSVIRPGDIVLSFPGFVAEGNGPISKIKGNGSFHMQNATLSLPMERTSMARVGAKYPYARVLNYPINATLNVSSVLSDIDAENLIEIISGCRDQLNKDISITLNRCVPSPFEDIPDSVEPSIKWTLKGVDLISEVFTSQIGSNKAVDMAFRVQVGNADDITKGIVCETFNNCNIIGDQEQTIVYNIGGNEIKSVYGNIPDLWVKNSGEVAEYSIGSGVANIGSQSFYNTSGTSLQIPDNVRNIGYSAFQQCSSLESVEVGLYLTSIEYNAFYNCTSLDSISFCNSSLLKTIGVDAFRNTKLINLTLPSSVETIGQRAFFNITELQSASVGDSLVNIETSTFEGDLSLQTFESSDSVEKIGNNAFKGCTSLSNFYWSENISDVGDSAFYNCAQLPSVDFYEGLSGIGNLAFYQCFSIPEVIIPDSLIGLGAYAFVGCQGMTYLQFGSGLSETSSFSFLSCNSLSSIDWGDNIENIGNSSFQNCSSLPLLSLQDIVTGIGAEAFRSCTSLSGISFGSGLQEIGREAFYGCSSLGDLNLPINITTIGYGGFGACSSMSGTVVLPDSLTSMGTGVFASCISVESVDFGNSLDEINDYSFYACSSLTGFSIPSNILNVGIASFQNCISLVDMDISEGLELIENTAFYNCGFSGTIVLPQTLTGIEQQAFGQCSSLQGVDLGSVTDIGNTAFSTCVSLNNIDFPASLVNIGSQTFQYCFSLESISDFPEGLLTIGFYAFSECPLTGLLTIPDSTTFIGENAFRETLVSGVDLGAGITSIENSVFASAINLEYINLQGVTSIGSSAFSYCGSLTGVQIPNVTSLGSYAFNRCDLGEIAIPNAVENIPSSCFRLNPRLSGIISGQGLTGIDSYAFTFTNLSGYQAPSGLTQIGNSAFNGCSSMATLDLNQVETIGSSTFGGCTSLAVVDIPESTTSLGSYAFNNCSSINSLTIGSGISVMLNNVFDGCASIPSLVLPDTIEEIASQGTFYGCSSLETIVFPSGLRHVGGSYGSYNTYRGAFQACTSLTGLEFPSTLNGLGRNAFSQCSAISGIRFTSVVAPKTRRDAIPDQFVTDSVNNTIYAPLGSELSYSGLSYVTVPGINGDSQPLDWDQMNIVFE